MTVRSERLRVLMVDDAAGDLALVCDAVEYLALPWDMRCVGSGKEAFALLDAGWVPDLAIVDLYLPGMDGSQVIDRLRQASGRMRVVALTGSRAEADVERTFAAGAIAVIHKPAVEDNYETIVSRIARIVETAPPAAGPQSRDDRPDLAILALARRCLRRGDARIRRAAFIDEIRKHARCDAAEAEAKLATLVAGGYLEQIGFGQDADLHPGHNLSSAVIRAFTPPQPPAPGP